MPERLPGLPVAASSRLPVTFAYSDEFVQELHLLPFYLLLYLPIENSTERFIYFVLRYYSMMP